MRTKTTQAEPWLIYAYGGGWGHLTRASALARAAAVYAPVSIRSNSAYTHRLPPAPELTCEPAVFIVDTFPRGITGELAGVLPSLKAKKVLIHRSLNPSYVEWAGLPEFVAAHYDLVVIPGPDEGGAFPGVVTDPWLIRDLPIRDAPPNDIVICAAGNTAELAWYGAVAALLPTALCIAAHCPPGCPPERWLRHWPALDYIAGARVVIGGAGYNTVAECLACGIPLIAKAWPRKYDLQRRRAEHAAVRGSVTLVEAPEEAAAAAHSYPPASSALCSNGAHAAAARIHSILS